MTTWFVSRHQGALEWVQRQSIGIDCHVAHLDMAQIVPGDTVIGTLPVQFAYAVCMRGASYLHLSLDIPAEWRGCELSAGDLVAAGAKLEQFIVRKKGTA
jgi:CRISPR-associated protein Csx16